MRCSPKHAEEVARIMTHDTVFSVISDDSTISSEQLGKSALGMLHNVGTYVLNPGQGMVVIFTPINYITYDVHIAAVKGELGQKDALKNTLDAGIWMADHTPIQKYVVMVPDLFPNVSKFCERIGMIREGYLKEAYLKRDILSDIIVYGMSKKDILKRR